MRVDLWQFCMVAETAMRARYDLSQPFSRGRYTYATNGHILVRTLRIVEDAEAHWPKIEAVTAAITHDALSPLPALEVQDAPECTTCKGFGVVRPCRVCSEGNCKKCADGWGYIPCRKPHPDQETCDTCEGRKVAYPKEAKVMLTDRCAIGPRYYRMLASLPDIRIDLSVDCVSTSWAKDRAMPGVSFAFEGGDGLVMPMRIYSKEAASLAA
jgi:hypothetical protein